MQRAADEFLGSFHVTVAVAVMVFTSMVEMTLE